MIIEDNSTELVENTSARVSENVCQIQQQFFDSIGGQQHFQELFRYIPGIYFFAKDLDSRMMCASQPIVTRLGFEKEAELIGSTDYDHFPQHVADKFVADDQKIIQTGQPLINLVEIWYNEQRLLDWFVTNKLPIFDAEQNVVGIMGTVRTYEGNRQSLLPYNQIDRVVEHIREHHRGKVSVTELAEIAEISPRQLHRRFLDVFGMSVQDFLNKTRIQAACDALTSSDRPIADIAMEFGFCDQSAFTAQFRKHIGVTPFRFRRQHKS